MGRAIRPCININDCYFPTVEYFEFDRPIKTIRSSCHYLTGTAANAVFNIAPCRNIFELIGAIQRIAHNQASKWPFGDKYPEEVLIQEIRINEISATVTLG